MQIRTGIHADTDSGIRADTSKKDTNSICPDTDKNTYQSTYMNIYSVSEYVLMYINTYVSEYVRIFAYLRICTQKYVHKYVRIPPVRIRLYLFQIRTEYVHVKRQMVLCILAEQDF